MLHILEHVVKTEGQKRNYFSIDTVLPYLHGGNYPSKAQNKTKEEDESALEVELKEIVSFEEKEDDLVPVQYAPLVEQLIPLFSYRDEADERSYAATASIFSYEEGYGSSSPANDNSAGFSINEEVRESMEDEKYAAISNSTESSTYDEEQRLEFWRKLNPAELAFYECLLSLNREVDYGPI